MSAPHHDLGRHPRRRPRPGVLIVALHWRVELATAGLVTAFVVSAGPWISLALVALVGIAATATPSIRRTALLVWRFTVLPHRVRQVLTHSRVTDDRGHPLGVLWAIPHDAHVRVEIDRRDGVPVEAVRAVAPAIARACGAAEVSVHDRPHRPDRLTVILAHPNWGLP